MISALYFFHSVKFRWKSNFVDEIGETDIEAAAEASTTDGVPHNLKMKVKIGTDTASINKIVNGLGRTVDDWLAETFTHVQNHYHHATLQHKIDFEAGNI